MEIEQVRLKKTLKAGKDVWVEGSYFPNNQYPSIPHDILLEVKLNTGTVEVLKYAEKPELIILDNVIKGRSTSTSINAKTSLPKGDSTEESPIDIKREEPVKQKSKPKLVRR